MRKTKRVYRFGHGCGSVRAEASRPGAMPARPEGDCIRNPRANWALRLHSCRALSSQPQTEANAPFKNAKVTKETCNPCARVLPMCQGETCNLCIGTFMDSRNLHGTALFCAVPRNQIFSSDLNLPHRHPLSSLCLCGFVGSLLVCLQESPIADVL